MCNSEGSVINRESSAHCYRVNAVCWEEFGVLGLRSLGRGGCGVGFPEDAEAGGEGVSDALNYVS